MSTELKDILKPPFYDAGLGLICDGNTRLMDVTGYVSTEKDKNDSHLAHIRGWGFFGYLKNGEEIQDNFKKFVVDALNEKAERDFSEPLRWIPKNKKEQFPLIYNICPKCNTTVTSTDIWNYCPHCGQKLLPPKD